MSNWLTYSPISGHGNGTITITASTLTGLEDRIATLIATGSQEGQTLSATTVITQKYLALTEIYFENLTWSTDVACSGGTATSVNCSFSIIAKYSDNSTKDITNLANVTGSLVVPATTATTRQSVGTLTLTATYEDKTCTGNIAVYQEGLPSPFLVEPLTFNIASAGTINWMAIEDSAAKTIEYKINNSEWVSITSNTAGTLINVSTGDIVKFKGDNTKYSRNSFGGSAVFSAEGNIMSLIDSEGFATATTLDSELAFNNIFGSCKGLTSAENLILPATILSYECYSFMFANCTSLTTPPKLPATTLTTNCYSNMFVGCTSLTTAPELPATTLASSCYAEMFDGCTSLNYIKCLATDISASDCTYFWVYGVSSTGTFVKASSMNNWATGDSGIPSGWTVTNAS